MENDLKKLTVLRNLLSDGVFAAFSESLGGDDESFYKFVAALYEKQPEAGLDFAKYAENLIYYDENIWAKCQAAGGAPPAPQITAAYLKDIATTAAALKKLCTRGLFTCNTDETAIFTQTEITANRWAQTYANNGYGRFLKHYAFVYENGKLLPSGMFDDISVNALKNYTEEKKLISDNIESFLLGLPYSDMLLYGDMGTGKSSTVRAMVKKYSDRKLRLIEVGRKNIAQIPEIRRLAASFPLKFLIFIDDLSIDGSDEKFSSLKVCLEGSSAVYKNSMVVATSNRRHIVKENFSDRENAVHANEAIQEELSLSDRFELTVMFSSTDKQEYLSIVKQLAADLQLMLVEDKLCDLAERWALIKGGRSPRRAKQFIDIVYAAQLKGVPVAF